MYVGQGRGGSRLLCIAQWSCSKPGQCTAARLHQAPVKPMGRHGNETCCPQLSARWRGRADLLSAGPQVRCSSAPGLWVQGAVHCMYCAAQPWSAASQPRPARSWSTACTARDAPCAPAWPPPPLAACRLHPRLQLAQAQRLAALPGATRRVVPGRRCLARALRCVLYMCLPAAIPSCYLVGRRVCAAGLCCHAWLLVGAEPQLACLATAVQRE